MTKEEIESKVIEITADTLEISADELNSDTNLVTDLGAESLDLVDLVVALEQEFTLEIADQDIKEIQTISDAVEDIASHIEQ